MFAVVSVESTTHIHRSKGNPELVFLNKRIYSQVLSHLQCHSQGTDEMLSTNRYQEYLRALMQANPLRWVYTSSHDGHSTTSRGSPAPASYLEAKVNCDEAILEKCQVLFMGIMTSSSGLSSHEYGLTVFSIVKPHCNRTPLSTRSGRGEIWPLNEVQDC